MSNLRRTIRQTLTVARRDFIATVFTPTFLIFLFAPLLMLGFGLIGGMGAARVTSGDAAKDRIIAIVPAAQGQVMTAIDKNLREIFRRSETPPTLMIEPPRADSAAQTRALFDRDDIEASAVLSGPLTAPTINYGSQGSRTASYLAELAEQTLRAERSGAGAKPLSVATKTAFVRERASAGGRNQAAFIGVLGIFFLTILLAGQAVGTMAEERSNKVIEVLAAAVPLESVFLGKLLGMFGVAILFVGFWGTIVANVGALAPPQLVRAFSDAGFAVGLPTFVLLFFVYFTMAYLLLGAVFLGIGAQASTMREIQMMSLPITFFQFGMFALASAAAAKPGTLIATVAEVFPFSSPFAMAAHAANSAALWPHALAIAWQLLWVAVTITIAARLFRRGVLQSGAPARRWWQRGKVGKTLEAAGSIRI
ncbi:MAG: ABC transporter permease [Pseudomonadota bacterium]